MSLPLLEMILKRTSLNYERAVLIEDLNPVSISRQTLKPQCGCGRAGATTATLRLKSLSTNGDRVEVLDENRSLVIQGGSFQDHFEQWEAHLYRIPSWNEGKPKAFTNLVRSL